jgi:hypothetical protein
LSADDIIHRWTEAGWVKTSPDGSELRLTVSVKNDTVGASRD